MYSNQIEKDLKDIRDEYLNVFDKKDEQTLFYFILNFLSSYKKRRISIWRRNF